MSRLKMKLHKTNTGWENLVLTTPGNDDVDIHFQRYGEHDGRAYVRTAIDAYDGVKAHVAARWLHETDTCLSTFVGFNLYLYRSARNPNVTAWESLLFTLPDIPGVVSVELDAVTRKHIAVTVDAPREIDIRRVP